MPDQQLRTEDFFDRIDGLEYPELLICPDCANLPAPRPNDQRRIRLSRTSKLAAISAGTDAIQDESRYFLGRTLTGECDSYEMEAGLKKGGVQKVFDHQTEILGMGKVPTLDFGCGRGIALTEMLTISGVDQSKSVGLTTCEPSKIHEEVRKNVLTENALYLKPKTTDEIEPIRFGVVFSIFGALTYHPLNKSEGHSVFGLLHIINLLQEQGLGIVNPTAERTKTLKRFFELGITEPPTDLAENVIDESTLHRTLFRVKRRPTFNEIKQLLELQDGSEYQIYDRPY